MKPTCSGSVYGRPCPNEADSVLNRMHQLCDPCIDGLIRALKKTIQDCLKPKR